jgi:long-subunit acyl-CoA synthetase (AMP-forming)
MLGYFKAKDLTDEVLDEDGFLHTGDLGDIDDAGRLKIPGRVKELFKTSKGKYVAPSPIENALLRHEAVEQACVSGADKPSPFGMVILSEQARAQVEEPEQKKRLEAELLAHLEATNATLDHHERLAKLVVISDEWSVENGMLTPTMKLKRAAIEKEYVPKADAWYAEKGKVLWE